MTRPFRMASVTYATASSDAAAALVLARYDVAGPLACTLLHRGFNDLYAVGDDLVLRISGHRARGPADVAAETGFLAHLDAAGVPVARAIPTREGAPFCAVAMPDDERPAVLFRRAHGRAPDLESPGDARAQAITLARMHQAAASYPDREAGRYKLDLDYLLHRSVSAILALGLDAPKARDDLQAVAHRLDAGVTRLELTQTLCHGDCHGLNARIAADGQAVFFDFDDSGYGYLAYDLAVHLWAQVSFGRRQFGVWHGFDAGYRAVRPLAPADEAALPLFVAIRHIWLMGEYASRARTQWGTEALSAAWLQRELGWLLVWEQERLVPRLL